MSSTNSNMSSSNSNTSSTNSSMSSTEHLPVINNGKVETYKQLRQRILTDQAKQHVEHTAKEFDLNVALVVLDDDASVVEEPSRRWYSPSWRKDRRSVREGVKQKRTLQEPYTYQGTRGYGKLAAQQGR